MIYVITEDLLGYSTSGSLIRSSYGTSVVGGYCCAAKRKVEKRFLRIKSLAKTKRRYATILADPPWPYKRHLGNQDRAHGKPRGVPYVEMSFIEIEALPIHDLALPNCQLWLWATGPLLHEAFHVIAAWGFTYRAMRVWVKYQVNSGAGMGQWFWGQTEYLLVASIGKTKPRSPLFGSYFYSPITKHSQKPRQSYRDIEAMSQEPRIELFARRARKGWDSWGNEAKELDKELERDVRRYL